MAERDRETIGAFLEKVSRRTRRAGEPGGGRGPGRGGARGAHGAAARLVYARVFQAVPKLAAERGMSVPALIEDLLAREVERLDPHGGKFGVNVEK